MEQVCSPVISSEEQKLINAEVAEVPPEERELYLGCIADEFIPPSQRLLFIDNALTYLDTPPHQVVKYPDKNPHGAYLIGVRDIFSEQPVGASFLKFHAAALLAPWLNVDIDYLHNQVKLVRFEDLQVNAGIPPEASAIVECAYSWVTPDCRHRGYGKRMVEETRETLRSIFRDEPTGIFGIVRCTKQTASLGQKLFQYLCDRGTSTDGIGQTQRSIIAGIPFPLNETLRNLRIPEQYLHDGIDPRSEATRHMFEEYGLKHVGFTKVLAPIYAGVLS